MARVLVNPRIGVMAKAKAVGSTQQNMKDILGVFDQIVYDTVAKKYVPALASDLSG